MQYNLKQNNFFNQIFISFLVVLVTCQKPQFKGVPLEKKMQESFFFN